MADNGGTTMGTEMITNFTAAARAQMDALLADAKGYEEKRAACLADAERLRMALVALGQTAPTVPTNGRPRPTTAAPVKPRKRMKNRAPDGSQRAIILGHAATVDTFTKLDVPSGVGVTATNNAAVDGLLSVVGHRLSERSGRSLNIYQITDKGRAWLAAHSKGAK